MVFIDAHCHVYGENLDRLLARAREKRVGIIVNSGANVTANRKTLQLASIFKEFRATMGLYPGDALKMSDDEIDREIEFIRENRKKIVAICEVGMDFSRDEGGERERQERIFLNFISLARELGKPLVVHSRKAEKEVIEILEKTKARRVMMHCFSGRTKLVEQVIKNRWILSIPTCVTRSTHFQHVIRLTPITQLLCETDSPFMHPLGGNRENEPANVVASYEKIAEIKGISIKEAEKKLWENFRKLFGN